MAIKAQFPRPQRRIVAKKGLTANEPIAISGELMVFTPEGALRIAQLDPFPHPRFIALSDPARHRAILFADRIPRDFEDAADWVFNVSADRVCARFCPDLAGAPMRAISKLHGPGFSYSVYGMLGELIRNDPDARACLMHMPQITMSVVERLAVLPAGFRREPILRRLPTPTLARTFADVLEVALAAPGVDRRVLIERFSRARTTRSLAQMAEAAAAARPFALPSPPADAPLRRLITPRDLNECARRFENCLHERRYRHRAHAELSIFFEWQGEEPAVIEIVREAPYGWRLDQVRGLRNHGVTVATLRAIHSAMVQMQVRVAKVSAVDLIQRLELAVHLSEIVPGET
jgi:hypothetical protein